MSTIRVNGVRVTNVAAQRQRRFLKRLNFAIFRREDRPRLCDGKVLPCSRCGASTLESLFEVFCAECI